MNEYNKLREEINIEKISKIAHRSKLASLLLIPILFIVYIFGIYNLNSQSNQIAELNASSLEIRKKIEKTKIEYESLIKLKAELQAELMESYGLNLDSVGSKDVKSVINKSLRANSAIIKIGKMKRIRQPINVEYYNKTIDDKRVAVELEALGYQFVSKRPSKVMSRKETNALWFGSNVPVEDVKVVAFTLIRAGVQLKAIRPYRTSKSNSNYKANVIEVGASNDVINEPPLAVEQIQSAKMFDR